MTVKVDWLNASYTMNNSGVVSSIASFLCHCVVPAQSNKMALRAAFPVCLACVARHCEQCNWLSSAQPLCRWVAVCATMVVRYFARDKKDAGCSWHSINDSHAIRRVTYGTNFHLPYTNSLFVEDMAQVGKRESTRTHNAMNEPLAKK